MPNAERCANVHNTALQESWAPAKALPPQNSPRPSTNPRHPFRISSPNASRSRSKSATRRSLLTHRLQQGPRSVVAVRQVRLSQIKMAIQSTSSASSSRLDGEAAMAAGAAKSSHEARALPLPLPPHVVSSGAGRAGSRRGAQAACVELLPVPRELPPLLKAGHERPSGSCTVTAASMSGGGLGSAPISAFAAASTFQERFCGGSGR